MKHDTHARPEKPFAPFDVYRMWGMPGPFEDAGNAYRAWFDGARQMQSEAVDFFKDRVGKDLEMLAEWGHCATPVEAIELQARYGRDAVADYLAEGRRMFALLGGPAEAAK